MVEYLNELGVGILFAIGGDGTLRGAQKIGEEAARRGLKIGVIGVPKTIDNDVSFVQRTFGFETAVTEAQRSTRAANAEAEAARNGIGLVKLMGRDSGFIAAYSALVNAHVNFCLVPEVPFTLERFLSALDERIERRSHAVIVVAEGAGQDLMAKSQERDASGNVKYGDIGVFLRNAINDHFKRTGTPITLKYIDPSYTIRSVPATAHDAAFCLLLGQMPSTRASAGARTWSSASGITSSRTCRSRSRYRSGRRSIRTAHSGTAWSRRPVSRSTCSIDHLVIWLSGQFNFDTSFH